MPNDSGGLKLNIRIIGAESLIRKLATVYPDRLRRAVYEALIEGGAEAVTEARQLAPFKKGHLRRSIKFQVDPYRLRAVLVAGDSLVNYAKYQEFGTYANRIEPGDLDSIMGMIRGGMAGVKRGKGVTAKLFAHRGVSKAVPRIKRVIEIKINNLIRETSGIV